MIVGLNTFYLLRFLPLPANEPHVPSDGITHDDDSDKSSAEEDVCPICLNELDEGEDLLVCAGCHNRLHQHCMDVCKCN